MKNIGIVIAIVREFKAFLDANFKTEIIKDHGYEIYKTNVNGNNIYAIKSGFGKIDAAAATQLLISKFDCEVILNYGVSGAIRENLEVKDLFVVNNAVNYDYDVSPIDPVVKNQYEEFKDIYIPLDKELIEIAKSIDSNLKDANVASGDAFIVDRNIKDYLNMKLDCNLCEMEVAAIARISYLNNVKCLSIKCISDNLEGTGGDFEKNVNEAGKKAFDIIKKILLKL